jgi:hypothetical protein
VFIETWFKDSFQSSELGMDDYEVYRCDRDIPGVGMGGGVLIAVKKQFKSSLVKLFTN